MYFLGPAQVCHIVKHSTRHRFSRLNASERWAELLKILSGMDGGVFTKSGAVESGLIHSPANKAGITTE